MGNSSSSDTFYAPWQRYIEGRFRARCDGCDAFVLSESLVVDASAAWARNGIDGACDGKHDDGRDRDRDRMPARAAVLVAEYACGPTDLQQRWRAHGRQTLWKDHTRSVLAQGSKTLLDSDARQVARTAAWFVDAFQDSMLRALPLVRMRDDPYVCIRAEEGATLEEDRAGDEREKTEQEQEPEAENESDAEPDEREQEQEQEQDESAHSLEPDELASTFASQEPGIIVLCIYVRTYTCANFVCL
jgi:hypothetical protein